MTQASKLAGLAAEYLHRVQKLVDPLSILLPLGAEKTETGAVYKRATRAYDAKRATVIKTAKEVRRLSATADLEFEQAVKEAERKRKDRTRAATRILEDCSAHMADLEDLAKEVEKISKAMRDGAIVDRSPDVVERTLNEKLSAKKLAAAIADIEGDEDE